VRSAYFLGVAFALRWQKRLQSGLDALRLMLYAARLN
jgi:hypothetical protein